MPSCRVQGQLYAPPPPTYVTDFVLMITHIRITSVATEFIWGFYSGNKVNYSTFPHSAHTTLRSRSSFMFVFRWTHSTSTNVSNKAPRSRCGRYLVMQQHLIEWACRRVWVVFAAQTNLNSFNNLQCTCNKPWRIQMFAVAAEMKRRWLDTIHPASVCSLHLLRKKKLENASCSLCQLFGDNLISWHKLQLWVNATESTANNSNLPREYSTLLRAHLEGTDVFMSTIVVFHTIYSLLST